MSKAEKLVENVAASMAMEDLILTDEEKALLLACAEGKTSFEDAIAMLKGMYPVAQ